MAAGRTTRPALLERRPPPFPESAAGADDGGCAEAGFRADPGKTLPGEAQFDGAPSQNTWAGLERGWHYLQVPAGLEKFMFNKFLINTLFGAGRACLEDRARGVWS